MLLLKLLNAKIVLCLILTAAAVIGSFLLQMDGAAERLRKAGAEAVHKNRQAMQDSRNWRLK